MPFIDLTQYGYPCSVLGSVHAERQEGQRFLFLFDETHTIYPVIKNNLLNACTLVDHGFIACVGVEGVYDFGDWSAEEIEEESQSLLAQDGNDLALIDFFIQDAHDMDQADPGRPHFFFGNCLKLLRPSVPVRSVETDEYDSEASQVQNDIIFKHARLNAISVAQFVQYLRTGTRKEITDPAMLEFRNHAVNAKRDQAFLENLFDFWQESGGVGPIGKSAPVLSRRRAPLRWDSRLA